MSDAIDNFPTPSNDELNNVFDQEFARLPDGEQADEMVPEFQAQATNNNGVAFPRQVYGPRHSNSTQGAPSVNAGGVRSAPDTHFVYTPIANQHASPPIQHVNNDGVPSSMSHDHSQPSTGTTLHTTTPHRPTNSPNPPASRQEYDKNYFQPSYYTLNTPPAPSHQSIGAGFLQSDVNGQQVDMNAMHHNVGGSWPTSYGGNNAFPVNTQTHERWSQSPVADGRQDAQNFQNSQNRNDTLKPGGDDMQDGYGVQDGSHMQDGSDSENGFHIEDSFTVENGFHLEDDFAVKNGFHAENGSIVENGFHIENGLTVENGFHIEEGFAVKNGFHVENGFIVENDFDIKNGSDMEDGYIMKNSSNMNNGHFNTQNGHNEIPDLQQQHPVQIGCGKSGRKPPGRKGQPKPGSYTAIDEAILIEGHHEGATLLEMSAVLGRSAPGIEHKLRRMRREGTLPELEI